MAGEPPRCDSRRPVACRGAIRAGLTGTAGRLGAVETNRGIARHSETKMRGSESAEISRTPATLQRRYMAMHPDGVSTGAGVAPAVTAWKGGRRH
jgi:hypothetical protein